MRLKYSNLTLVPCSNKEATLKTLVRLTALFLVVFSLNAMAEANIAFIDGARIIEKYEPIIDTKLQEEFKADQEKIVALQKTLVAQSEQYNRDAAVLSADEVAKMREKFEKDQMEFQRLSTEYNQKRGTRGNQELEKLLNDVKTAAEAIAKKGNYSVVLQKGAAIYFADAKADITDEVMKNITYK